MNDREIKKYLRSAKYAGFIKNQYEKYCLLELNEIKNFVSNVGRYADVEIMHGKSYEILFDTYGPYINRVWPGLSSSDRYNLSHTINRMASHLQDIMNREEDPAPLDKVREFMIDTLGMEKVKSNDELVKAVMEEQMAEKEMKMNM